MGPHSPSTRASGTSPPPPSTSMSAVLLLAVLLGLLAGAQSAPPDNVDSQTRVKVEKAVQAHMTVVLCEFTTPTEGHKEGDPKQIKGGLDCQVDCACAKGEKCSFELKGDSGEKHFFCQKPPLKKMDSNAYSNGLLLGDSDPTAKVVIHDDHE